MQHVIKYVLAAMAGAGIVAIASLIWPKFTAKPEPAVLRNVRDVVLGTEVGKQASTILGVENENTPPLNLTDTVDSVTGAVTSSVEQKVRQIVSDQVAAQVVKQYQQLPAVQQDRVAEMVCKPKE